MNDEAENVRSDLVRAKTLANGQLELSVAQSL
jgi:hypothetical protein